MEGNNHGYIQDDMVYDDLMNTSAWAGPGDQYQFSQAHPPPQDQYQYATNPPSYDHFDLSQHQQQAYPPVTFSNSPYTSNQHARPSDVFGPTSYNVDPSLYSSTAFQQPQSSFSYAPQATENATISPHSLQYNMQPNPLLNREAATSTFQRASSGFENKPEYSFSHGPQDRQTVYFNEQQNNMQQRSENAVRYPSLPNGVSSNDSKQTVSRYVEGDQSSTASRPQQFKPIPPQDPLRITEPELYASKSSSSRPRFDYAPYVAWQDEPIQVAPGLKNTLPKYRPRKARSGRELVPGFDLSRSSAPARVSIKKIRAPKEKKATVSKWKGTSQGPKPVVSKIANLRGEDGSLSAIKSPTPTETSSSEEDSSSEEESEYEDDEEIPVQDISEVREATRPIDPAAAAGWDAIGIIWKDPNSSPSAEVVKTAIEEYANFVSALRARIKKNATQIEEAASRPAELAKLKSERKVQLEALYRTIDAANSLGYPAIVENLGGHQKLVNGLTTTLIECIKTEDFLGKLPKAVFSLLAKFQTMSDELLKKLKFDSIQKRWNKKGDEETKKNITAILANTTDAKERAGQAKKETVKTEEEKKAPEKTELAKTRNTESIRTPSSSNPAKRPHDGDGTNGKPKKKFASEVAGIPAISSSKSVPAKRPSNLLGNNLLGIASKPAPKPVVKKRELSPPAESKLGALLASIAKPPEPPKAPEAPPRPPETPEEKKRRERKESRRHLRVKFKEGAELEQIRLFKHDLAEDEGRENDMLRDAHDDRSEGMMLKQRLSEDSGMEDDDLPSGELEDRPYPDLVGIDFSNLDKATMFGPTYVTRGGEQAFTTQEQKTQERREGLELMVVYTDPRDIPPSPKEPPQTDGAGDVQPEKQIKEPTTPWIAQRLQEIRTYGPEYANQIFVRRLEEQQFRELRENQARGIGQNHPSADISSILQQLGGPSQQPHLPQDNTGTLATMDSKAWENLLITIESLKGKPYPPVEPPTWMQNEAQRAEWWEGFNRDKAANDKKMADERMAQIQAAQFQTPPMLPPQVPQPIPVPQMQPYPPQAPQPNISSVPQVPDVTQQVQNILAGYTNGENNGPSPQQFDFTAWAASQGQNYGSQNQQPKWDGDWNNESTRQRTNNNQDSSSSNNKQRGYEMKQWNGGHSNDGAFDDKGQYKGKKKPCRFWKEGKCAKGAKCTFLHD